MIDWSLLIVLLRNHGHQTGRVSKETKLDYQHLIRLGLGLVAEPRFNSGIRLLDYAYDHLPLEIFQRVRVQ